MTIRNWEETSCLWLEREIIASIIVKEAALEVLDAFHAIHNYVDTDKMILRKDAISAIDGERVFIPINMRDGSVLGIGERVRVGWFFYFDKDIFNPLSILLVLPILHLLFYIHIRLQLWLALNLEVSLLFHLFSHYALQLMTQFCLDFLLLYQFR